MSEPEVKFEIDEHGRIECRVTNEGVLLSKEEKELIISNILRMQEENTKLRIALTAVLQCSGITKRDKGCDACPMYDKEKEYVWVGDWCGIRRFIRELGVEVGE